MEWVRNKIIKISKSCPQGSLPPACQGATFTIYSAPYTKKVTYSTTEAYTDCATGTYEDETSDNFKLKDMNLNSGYYSVTGFVAQSPDNASTISVKIYQDNTISDDFIFSASNGTTSQSFYLNNGNDYYIATPYTSVQPGLYNNFAVCFKFIHS